MDRLANHVPGAKREAEKENIGQFSRFGPSIASSEASGLEGNYFPAIKLMNSSLVLASRFARRNWWTKAVLLSLSLRFRHLVDQISPSQLRFSYFLG